MYSTCTFASCFRSLFMSDGVRAWCTSASFHGSLEGAVASCQENCIQRQFRVESREESQLFPLRCTKCLPHCNNLCHRNSIDSAKQLGPQDVTAWMHGTARTIAAFCKTCRSCPSWAALDESHSEWASWRSFHRV